MKTQEYLFTIEGSYDISSRLNPEFSAEGVVVGFNSKKETIRLVAALEIESDDGEIRYVTSEKEMGSVGFTNLCYKCLDFYQSKEEL